MTSPEVDRAWRVPWLALAAVIIALMIGIGIGWASAKVSAPLSVATRTAVATATVTAPAAPNVNGGSSVGEFTDGMYVVGVDIAPGNYHTDGGNTCYWERLNNLSGGFTGIISNGQSSGPQTVRVLASDKAFNVRGGCTWAMK